MKKFCTSLSDDATNINGFEKLKWLKPPLPREEGGGEGGGCKLCKSFFRSDLKSYKS